MFLVYENVATITKSQSRSSNIVVMNNANNFSNYLQMNDLLYPYVSLRANEKQNFNLLVKQKATVT